MGRGAALSAVSHRAAGAAAALHELLEMIKFQHALFALPFAFTSMLAAAEGLPSAGTIGLVVACMVTARTAAMTWNRIADRDVDAANPRTRDRALPAGRVGMGAAWSLLVASCALFVLAAAALNALTFALSPLALAVILGYSLTKRFTWATHFVLGLSLAIAPVGAWIAVRAELGSEPLVLGLAVLAWTAGFDILYACQDAEFDRSHGLASVPARFGVRNALRVARASHVAAVGALIAFGVLGERGLAFHGAVALAAGVMAWSHAIVRPEDLSRVGLAFFQANVAVGAIVLAGTALDVLAG